MAIPCSPARVVRTERLSPHLQLLQFETIGGWRWHADGRGDERIDIALPRPGRDRADLDVFNSPEYGRGWVGDEPPWRHYTVRRVHDGGARFDIEFVLHESGLASSWAERAAPGHVIGVFDEERTSAYYAPPRDAGFQLLVADATGLPGLGRIVEQLPPGVRATAIVEVAEPEDVLPLATSADVRFHWISGSGNGVAPSRLAEEVSLLTAPGEPWYAWVACEAATSRAIRKDLRTRLGLDRTRHHAIGYWTANATGDQAAEVEG